MRERRPDLTALQRELREIAVASTTLHQRAEEVLAFLGRIVPFDAAWLAVRDPERRRHVPVATVGPADALRRYFITPEADEEVEQLGLNRARAPMLAGEIPVPLPELRAWAEHLLPAGFRGGLAAGLFTPTGRHVGFLSMLCGDPRRPDAVDKRIVGAVRSVIAGEVDRTRDIAETARLIEDASAGVVLTRDGDVLPLPGLPEDRLLTRDSPVVATAAEELADSGSYIGFLVPTGADDPERLIRVTALDCAVPDLDHLSAAVLLSPPGDLRGLRVFDLRVLGLVVHGMTSVPAIAGALGAHPDRVADALGAALVALTAPNLTVAAAQALRGGLRIPPRLAGDG